MDNCKICDRTILNNFMFCRCCADKYDVRCGRKYLKRMDMKNHHTIFICDSCIEIISSTERDDYER
jgi:hypothetical protein